MIIISDVLVGLVALIHAYILVLEMFLWTSPIGRRVSGATPEFAEQTRALGMNQGLYNGFLAAGLIEGRYPPTGPSVASWQGLRLLRRNGEYRGGRRRRDRLG